MEEDCSKLRALTLMQPKSCPMMFSPGGLRLYHFVPAIKRTKIYQMNHLDRTDSCHWGIQEGAPGTPPGVQILSFSCSLRQKIELGIGSPLPLQTFRPNLLCSLSGNNFLHKVKEAAEIDLSFNSSCCHQK